MNVLPRIWLVAGVATVLGSCEAVAGPDWLVAEAPSPDRRLVARLWCEDFCDVPEAASLTISPASRRIPLARDEFGQREGEMPAADFVVRVFRGEVQQPIALAWAGPAVVTLEGRCLTDGNLRLLNDLRTAAVTVRIAQTGSCGKPSG